MRQSFGANTPRSPQRGEEANQFSAEVKHYMAATLQHLQHSVSTEREGQLQVAASGDEVAHAEREKSPFLRILVSLKPSDSLRRASGCSAGLGGLALLVAFDHGGWLCQQPSSGGLGVGRWIAGNFRTLPRTSIVNAWRFSTIFRQLP